MGLNKDTTFEQPKQPVSLDSATLSALINPEKDEVNKVTRAAQEQEQNTLRLGQKGGTTEQSNGVMNRAQDLIAETVNLENKKEKEERAMRSALKQVQQLLEQQLEELNKQIAALTEKIEVLEEEISETEKTLQEEFGPDWKEKFKKGEVDSNHPLYMQWLMQQQQLSELQQLRDKLGKKVEDLSASNEKIDNDQTLSGQEKLEKKHKLLVEAKETTLWSARAIEKIEGPNSSGVPLNESSSPLQEKLQEGAVVEGDAAVGQEIRAAESSGFASSNFLAMSMKGEGTYGEGIGKEGLSSKDTFNACSGACADPAPTEQMNIDLEKENTAPQTENTTLQTSF